MVAGRIRIVGTLDVANPVTAVGLVTTIALFIIRLKPYLETFDVYLRPPGETEETGETPIRRQWRRHPARHRRTAKGVSAGMGC